MRFVSISVLFAGSLLLAVDPRAQAQELLPTSGWGSLSGKVTVNGDLPKVVDLTAEMMKNPDKACCLDPKAKPEEKVRAIWMVEPKTKAVANVFVWVKAPAGKYLPTHEKYKKRPETVVFDQPHCAFLPRAAVFQPFYREGSKKVPTGQTLIIRNSAPISHNVRCLGSAVNPGFNKIVPAKADFDITEMLQPQFLPLEINCDFHPWMSARVLVLDHPYYAITKEDGSYEIPLAPAGAEVNIMAWHEGSGYGLTKTGRPMTLKEGKNTLDFQVTPFAN